MPRASGWGFFPSAVQHGGAVAVKARLKFHDLPQLPTLQKLLNGQKIGVPAAVLVGCYEQIFLFGQFNQRFGFGHGIGKRLFDYHVFARFERGAGVAVVGVVWCANKHQINGGVGQKFGVAPHNFNGRVKQLRFVGISFYYFG